MTKRRIEDTLEFEQLVQRLTAVVEREVVSSSFGHGVIGTALLTLGVQLMANEIPTDDIESYVVGILSEIKPMPGLGTEQ